MAHPKDEEIFLDPTEQRQNCPLCGNPATYKMRKFGKVKLFFCPIKCTSFVLYIDAEEHISKISKHYKKTYSGYAKECDKDKILVIDVQHTLAAILNTSQGAMPVDYATTSPYYEPRSNWF
jgi:hypothetical protein